MKYWLVKSEPNKYSWQQFVLDGRTFWDGVRNYQARNNLKQMQIDDCVLFYHSNVGKEVVGIAQVVQTYYPDPTSDTKDWVVVDLVPLTQLNKAVSLEQIKADVLLENIALVKQGRLSVMPLTSLEFDRIVSLGGLQNTY